MRDLTIPSTVYQPVHCSIVYTIHVTFISDWNNETFSELWPGWDRTIRLTGAYVDYVISKDERGIKDIGKYDIFTEILLSL